MMAVGEGSYSRMGKVLVGKRLVDVERRAFMPGYYLAKRCHGVRCDYCRRHRSGIRANLDPHPRRRRGLSLTGKGNWDQDWGISFAAASATAADFAATAAARASAFSWAAFCLSCRSIARSLPGFTGFLNSAPSRPRRRDRFRM